MAGFRRLFLLLVVAVLGHVALAYTTTSDPWYPRTTTAGTSDPWYPRTTTAGTSDPWYPRTTTAGTSDPWYPTTTPTPANPTADTSYNRRPSSPYPWNGVASTYPWYATTSNRGWGSRWPYASTEGSTSDWRYQTSSGSSYGCGTKHFNSLSGYITSPNYPGDYFDNAHCEYYIDPGTYVYLHIVDKYLESCCDHLVIYDRYGNKVTGNDYLHGSYFRVVFTSDGSGVRRGFKLYYDRDASSFPSYPTTDSSYNRQSSSPYPRNGMAWSGSRWPYASTEGSTSDWRYQTSSDSSYGCGTKHFNSLSGYITSPNYPGDYFNNAICEYIIDPGTYVYLRVVDKQLESCCDHLVIYDRYGNNVTGNDYLNGNYFRVVFTSDGSMVYRGFKLYYGGDASSFPSYPTTDSSYNRRSSSPYPWYGKASTYPWYVTTPDRGSGSRWPYASTEGEWSDWRYQTSSDSSYDCGTKRITSLSGYITSPNYPGDYFNNAHCEYIIDPGTYVYLQVFDKYLESGCDHLVIYDQHGNDVNVNDYLYGSYFRVVFTSDHSVVRRGFKLYYGPEFSSFPTFSTTGWGSKWSYASTEGWGTRWPYASTEGSTSDWRYQTSPGYACGETSYSTSGVFQSPNYPVSYSNNLHCVYRVYPSYSIVLSIDDLMLEQKYDFLKIAYADVYGYQRTESFTGSNRGTMVGSHFEITFTTDRSNTARGFKLSWRPNSSWESTTNVYYRPSSNWWGWSSQAPSGNVMVTCDSGDFKVTVPRDMIQQVFPGSSPYDLTLNDANCRGQIYYDVVMFRSSILGCGMTREETGYDIVYKNRIVTQVAGYYGTTTTRSIITRFNSKDISLECHLNRDVSIIGHFRPQHDHQLIARGRGNFSMHMDFYRDPGMSYRITSYPMYIGLNQDVYVDVGLESDDPDLKISLQNCVAKPSVDPYDYYSQYYLIRDGCPADQTVAFEYTSSLKHVHFRFRTFEFVRNNRDVYIFCYVRVCDDTDYEHRCRRDCNSMHQHVREASDARTDHDLHLFQGPLTFRENRNADFHVAERSSGNDSSTTTAVPAIVMAISAVAMVMAAVVMVIRGKRRNRSVTKGVDTKL